MSKTEEKFVEACESLAVSFEQEGRPDLAALCDRASYWLSGGNGVDVTSLSEIVESCRDTLREALSAGASLEQFIVKTADEIEQNLRAIGTATATARADGNAEDLVERAARLQAVAILTSDIFHRRDK